MFSILNTKEGKGNRRTRMCKFLDPLSKLFRSLGKWFPGCRYLYESERFRRRIFSMIGDRIAFLHVEPVMIRIRKGKD